MGDRRPAAPARAGLIRETRWLAHCGVHHGAFLQNPRRKMWVKTYERSWSERFEQLDVVLDELKEREATMTETSTGNATVTLPTDEQILITRDFDAPKHLVYTAYTTPELLRRWWSGHRGEMTVAEIDLRVGGAWRYVMVADGGFEVGFHGEYRELVPNERIVATEIYERMPDAAALNTVTFAGADGRTTLTILVQHASKEHRDAHIDSGMEAGMQDAMDLLEEVASSLR